MASFCIQNGNMQMKVIPNMFLLPISLRLAPENNHPKLLHDKFRNMSLTHLHNSSNLQMSKTQHSKGSDDLICILNRKTKTKKNHWLISSYH